MLTQTIARLAAWACLAFIIFVTVGPIGLRPADLLPVNWDRALAFALMGALFVVAYPGYAFSCGTLIIAAAGAFELLQLLSPSRHAHFDDAVVKAAGAVLGLLTGWTVNRARDLIIART